MRLFLLSVLLRFLCSASVNWRRPNCCSCNRETRPGCLCIAFSFFAKVLPKLQNHLSLLPSHPCPAPACRFAGEQRASPALSPPLCRRSSKNNDRDCFSNKSSPLSLQAHKVCMCVLFTLFCDSVSRTECFQLKNCLLPRSGTPSLTSNKHQKLIFFKLVSSCLTHVLGEHLRFTQLHVLFPLLLEKMFSDVL